jgi:perosamine synthetase
MTKSLQIPLARPRLSADDIGAAVKILESGYLISGPAVEDFENQLAEYLGVQHVVCVSSGTAALHLGLLSLGIGHGDEVIVPAFSYPASANAVTLTGAKPVFIDSEPGGFNLDASSIENKITCHTRAIMVVHNFGWPVKIGKVKTLSAKYDIPIFEDAACALGSSVKGVKCGSLGRLAAFSFHPRKILTTGEGGAVATDDKKICQAINQLRNHGQALGTADFIHPGFNYRMTEFQAALGNSQLKRFETILEERRSAAAYYAQLLKDIEFIKPIRPQDGEEVNYQTYVAFVENDARDNLIKHLLSKGIGAGIGTYSIPHTSYYSKEYGIAPSDFPHSLNSFSNLISLPLYEGISKKEQDYVVEAIRQFIPEYAEMPH